MRSLFAFRWSNRTLQRVQEIENSLTHRDTASPNATETSRLGGWIPDAPVSGKTILADLADDTLEIVVLAHLAGGEKRITLAKNNPDALFSQALLQRCCLAALQELSLFFGICPSR